jgi:CubicO group peptidase (beta-lactamase class C family)
MVLLSACGGGHDAKSASAGGAQSSAVERPDARPRSQRVLEDAIKADAPGCSVAVGSKGTVVWTGVRGVANTATGDAISTDTVFDIGSVSKQFTATATLLLAGAGKLSVDDPLSKYMPELPEWASTVTLTQLIHQTSGIPEYEGLLQSRGYQISDHTTQSQALQAVGAVPALNFKPGTRFAYSGSNYLLLAEVVRRVSVVPLPQFLSAQIFGPLGLAMVMDPVGTIPHKAVSYASALEDYRVAGSAWEQVGDGGIQTTPSQLVRWADNYRTGSVGGQKLLDAQLSGAVQIGPNVPIRYAAGIYLRDDGTLDHDGAWAGFVTAFRVSKDRLTSVAVSCNTDEQSPEAMADAISKLWI